MSSASTGQLDTYVFMNPSPTVDFNSLQLSQSADTADNQGSSKHDSPNISDSIFNDDHAKSASITDSSANAHSDIKSPMSPVKTLDKSSLYLDDTILKDDSPVKQISTGASNEESSKPGEAAIAVNVTKSGHPQDLKSDVSSIDNSKVSAYARLEFENFIFYVQTLQVLLGRKSEHDQSHSVDVHLGESKAISRRHAKIFYNFGTERFELSIQGRNGAFVDDTFVERGATVPLTNKSKIQIGQIVFRFVLPGMNPEENSESPSKPINPSDAISLRSTLYHSSEGLHKSDENTPHLTSQDFKPVGADSNDEDSRSSSAVPNSTTPSILTPDKPSSSSISEKIKSTIPYTNPATVPQHHSITGLKTEPLESIPLSPIPTAPLVANIPAALAAKKPKEKKAPRPPKPPKKVYTIDEIPVEYRMKPACSYSNLIATCLRTHGTPKGMSLAEIYKSIRDIFPYYKYCADGWQSSVRHNLSLNKAFRKVSKEGKGWLWGLDEEYCAEKERAKKKQQEAATAKAKAAAQKLEQQQQQQQKLQQERLEQQRQLHLAQSAQQQFQQHSTTNASIVPSLNKSLQNQGVTVQQSTIPLQTGQKFINSSSPPSIPLQTQSASGAPKQQQQQQQQQQPSHPALNQFQNTLPQQVSDPSHIPKFAASIPPNNQAPAFQNNNNINTNNITNTQPPINSPNSQSKIPSIQAQLAANRGITPTQTAPPATQPIQSKSNNLNINTKKALTHLQQQLVMLSKDLRKLVDKPTISQILTQAIAMTIAQVTQAAKTKGITTDPLATLIDTNPQQLTRILTVALNAATFKVTNGRIKAPLTVGGVSNSSNNSRVGSPGPDATNLAKTVAVATTTSNNNQQAQGKPNVPLQRQVSAVPQSTRPTSQPNMPSNTSATQPQLQQQQQQPNQISPTITSQHSSQFSSTSSPAVNSAPLQTVGAIPHVKKAFIPLIQTNKTEDKKTDVPNSSPASGKPAVVNARLEKPEGINVSTEKTQTVNAGQPSSSLARPSQEPHPQPQPQATTPSQQTAPIHKPSSGSDIKQEKQQSDKLPAVLKEVTSSSSTSTTAESAGFNLDELNDPEFDKVLQSLSREPTPGVAGGSQDIHVQEGSSNDAGGKMLNDEELNKLLGSDFNNDEFAKHLKSETEDNVIGSGSDNNNVSGTKRSFTDVENSIDNDQNKMIKK